MADTPPIFASIDPATYLPPTKAVEAMDRAIVTPHVEAAMPHPAYDDAPDFTLLFENKLN